MGPVNRLQSLGIGQPEVEQDDVDAALGETLFASPMDSTWVSWSCTNPDR